MKCFDDNELQQLLANARQVRTPEELNAAALELVAAAKALSLVLTIEQVPSRPLAMGHYETVVAIRPARATA